MMTRRLSDRPPTLEEMLGPFARACVRLAGSSQHTADVIAMEIAGEPNYRRAAHALDVPAADLEDVFVAEMLERGFFIARGKPH